MDQIPLLPIWWRRLRLFHLWGPSPLLRRVFERLVKDEILRPLWILRIFLGYPWLLSGMSSQSETISIRIILWLDITFVTIQLPIYLHVMSITNWRIHLIKAGSIFHLIQPKFQHTKSIELIALLLMLPSITFWKIIRFPQNFTEMPANTNRNN